MRERYWVESAPGYVRLRHEIGAQGRIRSDQWCHQPETFGPDDEDDILPDEADEADRLVLPDEPAHLWAGEMETRPPVYWDETFGSDDATEESYREQVEVRYLESLGDEDREHYEKYGTLEKRRAAAAVRAARGAGGLSERSRAEMWRRVLSLPFDMLGDRPLWITLTYPRYWRPWVPDGRALEAHRRAFGERWRRNFGEPVGFWTKEFQLAEGRPHLHLLMRGPDPMPEADYRGFQERTRLAKANERRFGQHEGRARTEPIKMEYGGETAMMLRRWWAEIVTDDTDRRHYVRGVDVKTVFYSHEDAVALSKRRAAIAAYLAGETAKAKQKVPPEGFGTVGNYYGAWGRKLGFRPQVTAVEVDPDVWNQLNRRLTFLTGWRRAVRRSQGKPVGDGWRRRRSWQGITVGGLGPEDLARLTAQSIAAAERQRAVTPTPPPEPAAA